MLKKVIITGMSIISINVAVFVPSAAQANENNILPQGDHRYQTCIQSYNSLVRNREKLVRSTYDIKATEIKIDHLETLYGSPTISTVEEAKIVSSLKALRYELASLSNKQDAYASRSSKDELSLTRCDKANITRWMMAKKTIINNLRREQASYEQKADASKVLLDKAISALDKGTPNEDSFQRISYLSSVQNKRMNTYNYYASLAYAKESLVDFLS